MEIIKKKIITQNIEAKTEIKFSFHSLEELIEHDFIHLTRSSAIQFCHLIHFGHIAVQRTELATGVAEEHKEMFRFGTCNFLEYFLFGFTIHRTGENAIFDGIQNDATIRFGGWLFIEFWTCS